MATVSPKILEILAKAVDGGVEDLVVTVCDSNKKGEGYLGHIFFVSLEERRSGKQFHFVVKQAFSEKNVRGFTPIREVFLNEIYFYTTLWPKFRTFQERIPIAYHFNYLAKFMASSCEENFERLVFQDLNHEGFVAHDKKQTLKKDVLEFIFQAYGKFHAISFAYKALFPEEFSELVKDVIDVFDILAQKKFFQDSITRMHQQCLDNLQPGVNDAVIERYKHYVDDGADLFQKSLVSGKYTVITHGDCWSNNMMFKYDSEGKLVDLRLIDFQIVRLGSPVCDLSYCLYSGGTKEIFDDLDHLLQIYHTSLSQNLTAYGCDANDLYPLEAVRNDWKVHSHLGMTMGLLTWRGKLSDDDDIIDLRDISSTEGDWGEFSEKKYDKDTFEKRTRDIVLHFFENNYMF